MSLRLLEVKMTEGRNMGIYFIAAVAVLALIGAVIVYAQMEDRDSKRLLTQINYLESQYKSLHQKYSELSVQVSEDHDSVLAEIEKIRARQDEVLRRAGEAPKVELKQARPFYVQLVPENLKPKRKPVKK